jgi:hypothetical protein
MSTNASDLLVPADPLLAGGQPERVNYATGVLLQADDFRDEQTYHRARLATALRHIVGHGTIAGLRVVGPKKEDNEAELRVEAGIAIDRYGRLIEVAEPWCIRLTRWFAAQETGALRSAVHRDQGAPIPVGVVADLFLSVADCGRRKTPSFAQGPFDAVDALVSARLAEEPSFELVLRPETKPPEPENDWAAATTSDKDRREAVLSSYRAKHTEDGTEGELRLLLEQVDGHDRSSVFLARVTIPVTLAANSASDKRPILDLAKEVSANNDIRPFIFVPGKWLGTEPEQSP